MLGGEELLLQGLLNSNSHGDGHADHGVVASVGITGNRLEIVQSAQGKSQKFVKVSRLLPRFAPSATDGKSVLVTKVVPRLLLIRLFGIRIGAKIYAGVSS